MQSTFVNEKAFTILYNNFADIYNYLIFMLTVSCCTNKLIH